MKECVDYIIVTNKSDITSDFIVREMTRRNLNFLRVNTEDFASNNAMFKNIDGDTTLSINGKDIIPSKLKSAYFRRPHPIKHEINNYSDSVKNYIEEEWNYLIKSFYLQIGTKWFNHPTNIALAEDKPRQLRLAKDIGFLVPKTVITTEISYVLPLFEMGEVVAKPMKQSLLEDEVIDHVIFTSTITSPEEINKDHLKICPVIFQSKIHKKTDIRVTVIEDEIFSVAIKSQQNEKTKTDWRCGSVVDLPHEIIVLPEDIQNKAIQIVRKLGLKYGAIDLVLDGNDEFWFLECNPNGQWAWIENRTGLNIASSIVNSMMRD